MRTRYLDSDGNPRYSNRLLRELSPYLIQHGHNPVDWYPWGEEAFEAARREDKPLFLSVGYSTCHWCHVMERESFDNEEVAALLNAGFVPVKLDREQHPDVDELYMTALQLMTGRGGWPISCFLMGDGKPFFAATYLTARDFCRLLERVTEVWQGNRSALAQSAAQIAEQVAGFTSARSATVKLGAGLPKATASALTAQLDGTLGGFGTAPKFPQEPRLRFLLDAALRDDLALDPAATTTLTRMAEGGIHDQIGGGFHRYSVDAGWRVPHFEKMLYNQAQMIHLYAEAYGLTGEISYRRVVEQCVEFLVREMRDRTGLFYSAIDADSEGEEGRFYAWTMEDLTEALGSERAQRAATLFGVTASGDFEGGNVLRLSEGLAAAERATGDAVAELDALRADLLSARATRVRPLTDEKILTGWNGMVISALVDAARYVRDSAHLDLALAAAESLWALGWHDGDGLSRVLYAGKSSLQGNLEDYGAFGGALVALYDATGEARWLERARLLADRMTDLFADEEAGGFFMGHARGEGPLFARAKSPMDGATPSPNALALLLLIDLFARTGESGYRAAAFRTVEAFSGLVQETPEAFPTMLTGLARLVDGDRRDVQYAGDGHVKVCARASGSEDLIEFEVDVAIADGWHVAAHDDRQSGTPFALACESMAFELAGLEYPRSAGEQLDFEEEPWRVYSGRVVVRGTARRSAPAVTAALLPLSVSLQCCNERMCCNPQRLELRVRIERLST